MFNKHSKIRFSIKSKLILLSGILVIGSILAASLFHMLYSRQMLEKRIASDLLNLVGARADQITGIIEGNLHLAEMIASRRIPRKYLAMRERKDPLSDAQRIDTQNTLKDALDSCSLVSQVDVLDLKGEVVASTNIDQIGAELASSDFFSRGKKEIYIGGLYSKAGVVLIDIAVPLLDPESSAKRIIGVMRVVMLTEGIYNVLADYSNLGNTGELVLGKLEGQDIIFLNSLRNKADSAFNFKVPLSSSLAEPMRRALNKVNGVMSGLDYRGVSVLAAYKYIPIGGWGLVIKVDLKEAFVPVRDLFKYSGLVTCVVILISILAIFFFAGYITRPIKKLHEGIERISKGDFDFPVSFQSSDEIGQLSRAFGEMADNLKKITVSRDELNKEITEREKAQEAISVSEKKYRQLFDESNDAIIIADPQTKMFIDCNKKAQEMSGYSKQELLSMRADQFHPEDRVNETMEGFKKQAAGMSVVIESEILTKDKKRVAVSINAAAMEIDGKPYIMGVFRDISEHTRMEGILHDSEAKFKAIYESSNDAIMLLTEKGFFDCNQRTLELFGFKSKEEFTKAHPADISPPTQPNGQDSFSLSMERIKTAYNEGVNSFEWVHCSRDGTVFPANVLLTAFEYGGKRVLQATVRDLSESKKMEEVRRLAQLGELVSSIAHEVNNPLMIISGNAQLCQMEDLKNDSVKENLKMIVDQCERAKSIIHRMLVFSRPGKGQIKEMDINENLEFVTELVEHQYSLANVRIIRDFSASLPKVRADEKQMQEVFLNLIRNAAEAMPDGGTLTLTTALEDGFVRLEFIDTGAGMSGEVMDKIFYPFFSTKELGVGLGLSVSQSIIKIHGGEIKFKSKPGEGTVATVLLPIT